MAVESFDSVVCSIKSFPSGSLGEVTDLCDTLSYSLDLCIHRTKPGSSLAMRSQQSLTCGLEDTAWARKSGKRARVSVGGRLTCCDWFNYVRRVNTAAETHVGIYSIIVKYPRMGATHALAFIYSSAFLPDCLLHAKPSFELFRPAQKNNTNNIGNRSCWLEKKYEINKPNKSK